MKTTKILAVNLVCILLFLAFGYGSANAANLSSVYENLNIENCENEDLTFLKGLEDQMKRDISDSYHIDASMLPSSIDFSNSIKVYDFSDIPVFFSNKRQLSLMKTKSYGYYVFIPVGERMFSVVVSPSIRTKEWGIESYGEADSSSVLSMLSYNIDFLKKYDELYYVAGLAGFFYQVVLCVSDDTIEGVFTLEPMGTYPLGGKVKHDDKRFASFDAVNQA